jgi:bifunctional UDP-N-acetylglucosamine pyrophosphorylase/glucosamine-1-phosphate N-acetyltransferase
VEIAIILAAGEGTRMKSAKAKVLHEIAGRSLIGHVLGALKEIEPLTTAIVVGSGIEEVSKHIESTLPSAELIHQKERNGTGHATRLALSQLARGNSGSVIVLAGDTPLLTGLTLKNLVASHKESRARASILTAELADPFGYGRIVRGVNGDVMRIVEEKDCSDFERSLTEVNSGVYVFEVEDLSTALSKISNNNAQGEEYLTDVIKILKDENKSVNAYIAEDHSEIFGINDRIQLAECAAIMRDRINYQWMKSGVSIIDPMTTWIDLEVEIAPDVTLLPATSLYGKTIIETGSVIGPRTTLRDCSVGQGAQIIESHCQSSAIGYRAKVGPYSYLRAGTELATDVKVGAYVEIKNSTIGPASKVPHLSYIGDAQIGEGTNIGAATVVVNYDGVEKHRTEIGDHVRIGSDTMLIAPVSVGDGAYTAAGSVITEDVPPGAMGVGRSRQRNILDWVLRKRSGTKSAEVAKKKQNS